MKIIHTADIHLGSKMDSKFPKEKTEERKKELRNTFQRLIEYAETNNIKIVLLSGDVFDNDRPNKTDKTFFYSIIKAHPSIDFLYLKGNHDIDGAAFTDNYTNLKLFSDKWTSYHYENAVISGIELSNENIISYSSTLNLDQSNYNIVMLHGPLGEGVGMNISLKNLRNRNIDYLALGHIHKPEEGNLDDRGIYVYPGCLEGRGFDEFGDHGFVVLDTDTHTHKFIPFAKRKIIEHNVDVSSCKDSYQIYEKTMKNNQIQIENIYRLNLVGEIDDDTDIDIDAITGYFDGKCYFINIKNKTTRKIDISKYLNDTSIKGEFIRSVNNDDSLNDVEKNKILDCGLKALEGREFNL